MKFVDEATIYVTAGNGGDGCMSFRREKYVPKGGPDGGDGGDGGSVHLLGYRDFETLYDLKLKPHYRAGRGSHGKGKKKHGKKGNDLFIRVPLGVTAMNGDKMLGEILDHQQTILVAQGGKGGRGNARFVTSTNRAPTTCEEGQPGESAEILIILKLISDIGLVGLPNSGKSTLLKAITNAQPKIGDYPFTTLNPNLGVLKNDYNKIIIADMPGIVKGAHQGKGLGYRFLRHIERTKLLILVIDSTVRDPLAHYGCILAEFKSFNKSLTKKPRIVVFNKIDLLKTMPHYELSDVVFYISALMGTHVQDLVDHLMHEDKI